MASPIDAIFSERFMEDCIHENPTAFLGGSYKVLERQPKFFGFRPDLIVQSDKGVEICEIQQRGLNRGHLYKSLEYRDNYLEATGQENVGILLVCEKMEARYERAARSHGLSVLEIPRVRFIEVAVWHCPTIVISALNQKHAVDKDILESGDGGKIGSPIFNKHSSAIKLFTDLEKFLHQQAVDPSKDLPPPISSVYWELSHEIGCFPNFSSPFALLTPENWNAQKLFQTDAYDRQKFVRPKLNLYAWITSKNNLTVRLRPVDEHKPGAEKNWLSFPSSEQYGYERPRDEILYIRDFGRLPADRFLHYGGGPWSPFMEHIASDLIGITFRWIDNLISVVADFVDIHKASDWRFKYADSESENLLIEDFEIYNVAQEREQKLTAQFERFEADFGLKPNAFVQLREEATGAGVSDTYAKIHRLAKKAGISISPPKARSAEELLKELRIIQ